MATIPRRDPRWFYDAARATGFVRSIVRWRGTILGSVAVVTLAVTVLATTVVGAAVVGGSIATVGNVLDHVTIPPAPAQARTTFLFDDTGEHLTNLHAGINRIPIPLGAISPMFRHAVIAIEDRNFYHEGGVSVIGTIRAAFQDLAHHSLVQGGSTITQQYVKQIYTGSQPTFSRKIKEALIAERLSHLYSKNQILNRYLNTVYFGNGAYGAQAAAETYFSKPASQLTAGQSALLAGLVQSPASYDPVVYPGQAQRRRNVVLEAMARQGYLTLADAANLEARHFKLHLQRSGVDSTPAAYFVRYATHAMQQRFGYNQTFTGGLKVTTTLDPTMQAAAERAVASHLLLPTDPSAALVAIDPTSGAIRAMVGGRDFTHVKFNLATQAMRQEGSAFKTFTLTAAVEQGISLNSIWRGPPQLTVGDQRCVDTTTNTPWNVSNFADESAGTMPLRSAIAGSVNTIFAQVVTTVGPPAVVDVAHRMGITSKLQPFCSITLGSQATTPLQMADAYATLASNGVHHRPQVLAKVVAPGGKVLAQLDPTGNQALTPEVAATVTSALQGVIQFGTGTAANIGRPEAGKTGTGQNFQDAWFCGYVPQLATCVWVGYPAGEIPMQGIEGFADVFGGSIPALIWHDFMAAALANTPVQDFPVPPPDTPGGRYGILSPTPFPTPLLTPAPLFSPTP